MRRILGVPDLGIDIGQRPLVRCGDLFGQDAILAVFDTRDRDHGDTARQFKEMRPRQFDVERAQDRFVPRHQRERLDEDRRPAGPFGSLRPGLDQLANVEGPRQRHERHAHRRMHEVGDETARQ